MEQFTRGYWKMLENESYVNWFENVWICENCRHRFGKRPDQGQTMKKLLVEYLKPPTSSAIYYHMLDDFGYWDYWAFVLPIKKLSHSIYPIIISHIIPVLLVIYIYSIYECAYYIYIYIHTYIPLKLLRRSHIYIYIPWNLTAPGYWSDRLLQLRHLAWLSSGQPVSHPFLGASEFTLSVSVYP